MRLCFPANMSCNISSLSNIILENDRTFRSPDGDIHMVFMGRWEMCERVLFGCGILKKIFPFCKIGLLQKNYFLSGWTHHGSKSRALSCKWKLQHVPWWGWGGVGISLGLWPHGILMPCLLIKLWSQPSQNHIFSISWLRYLMIMDFR